jgi:hypothetical protein
MAQDQDFLNNAIEFIKDYLTVDWVELLSLLDFIEILRSAPD